MITQEIIDSLSIINQSRSEFQLRNFVVGAQDTDEMKYFQVCLELSELITSLRDIDLQIKRKNIEIDRFRKTGDELDEIDAQISENIALKMQRTKLSIESELKILIQIWNSFPIKYTREEIDAGQAEYWIKRLTRQAELEALGNGGIVSYGNMEALNQIGILNELISNTEKIINSNQDLLEVSDK